MSLTTLQPGDEVFYRAADGRRFRGRVADHLALRARGEAHQVPICKRSGKIAHWMARADVRKAPARKDIFP